MVALLRADRSGYRTGNGTIGLRLDGSSGPSLLDVAHTAGDVWVVADGPGSYSVSGWLDNNDLFRIIGRAILAKPENN